MVIMLIMINGLISLGEQLDMRVSMLIWGALVVGGMI